MRPISVVQQYAKWIFVLSRCFCLYQSSVSKLAYISYINYIRRLEYSRSNDGVACGDTAYHFSAYGNRAYRTSLIFRVTIRGQQCGSDILTDTDVLIYGVDRF